MQSNLDQDSGDASQEGTAQLSKEVKDLGRKARERLEEERRKRREIVRLQQDPIENIIREPKTAFSQAIREQRGKHPPAAKRKHIGKFVELTEPTENVDTWTPDVTCVSLCSDGERSKVVRLHGLPKLVKPESIRRFFSGLDVERIYVLLSNKTCIPEWDEREHYDAMMLVARHESSFRVYVKFVSSPAADMARARSQEFLYADQQDKKVGVHIAMTKVPKTIASYLQHNLAIDAVNGRPLHDTLVKEETRLDPRVPNLLWTMAMRDLNVSVLSTALGNEAKFPWQSDLSELNPLVFSDYQKLVGHHNLLVDEFEGTEQLTELSAMEEWNPEHSRDASVRLNRAAFNRLLDVIESVELTLYRARVELRKSTQSSNTTE